MLHFHWFALAAGLLKEFVIYYLSNDGQIWSSESNNGNKLTSGHVYTYLFKALLTPSERKACVYYMYNLTYIHHGTMETI